MKIIVILGLLILGFPTFACPKLAGKYSCKDSDETYIMTISQREVNKVTEYKVIEKNETEIILTNGQFSEREPQEGFKVQAKYSCQDNKVITDILGPAKTYALKGVTFKSSGGLTIEMTVTLNGKEQPKKTTLCKQI